MEKVLLLFILSFDLSGTFISIHDRHIKVTNNKIVLFVLNQLESVISILGSVDVNNLGLLNHLLEHAQNEKFVIHYKDLEVFDNSQLVFLLN